VVRSLRAGESEYGFWRWRRSSGDAGRGEKVPAHERENHPDHADRNRGAAEPEELTQIRLQANSKRRSITPLSAISSIPK
jgi:hypothetical protein